MLKNALSTGVVHRIPADLRTMLHDNPKVRLIWQDITPLARNEWICWVVSAKKAETRQRRIEVANSKLSSGMRRPCCWEGCTHRG